MVASPFSQEERTVFRHNNMDVKELDSEHFKSYISNVYTQVTRAIVFKELEKIDHFVNDEVYNYLTANVDRLAKNHPLSHYFDMTIIKIELLELKEFDNYDQLILYITVGYGKSTNDDKPYPIIKFNQLTFERKKDRDIQPEARYCPGCGANIDVNRNGKCEYCGGIYNLEDMDWVLIKFEAF
jgi:hypothetical protein